MTTDTPVRRPDRPVAARRQKLIGMAFLALPLAIFALFTVAEGIGGESGWWGHVIQLAIGVLLAVGAWRWPRVVGPLLIVVGAVLTGFVLVQAGDEGVANLAGVVLVFAPLLVSGVFFTLAGLASRAPHR
jgi:hypothetical protein